jgi:hypothetical protein
VNIDRKHLPFIGFAIAFLVFFFWGLNIGKLGHDYNYFFPKLLDGNWHFLRQGTGAVYVYPTLLRWISGVW